MPNNQNKADFPYWLVAVGLIFIAVTMVIFNHEIYNLVFEQVSKGIWMTVYVTLIGFFLSSILGLVIAIGLDSKWLIIRQFCRFYVEVIRAIPMLVLLFYFAFVGTPILVDLYNLIFALPQQWSWMEEAGIRDFSMMWRAIFALMIGYSAYIAEVFRAGFQSIEIGQIEAAKSLGLSRFATFYKIKFPQALRVILPPLGNDFIAMIKDSALVSVLGVSDITQMGKLYAASSFRFFETYNMVTFIYLILTISLSLGLRGLEKRMRDKQKLEENA